MEKDYIFSLDLLADLAAQSTEDHRAIARHVHVIEAALPPIRILILDDSTERHPYLLKKYSGLCRKITVVTRYNQAADLLVRGRWDLVSLDHDLGNDDNGADSYLDGKGIKQFFDGSHVVREIIYNKADVVQVVVHSSNTVKAPQMVADLKRAGIPSVWEPVNVLHPVR